MRPHTRAQLQIHLCVFLWGFTAILGKLITLTALTLVWWRMLIVVLSLLFIPRVRRGLWTMPKKLAIAYAATGIFVALHWLTFYLAIKLSNASVAATCIAFAPVFLAVIEPIVVRRPFKTVELLMGIAVVPGVALVLGGVPARMHIGLLAGATSAMLVAIFVSFNKRLVGRSDPLTVTCLELGAGTFLLTIIALLRSHVEGAPAFVIPSAHDSILLLILAIACTLIPFALSLEALRELSGYEVQLATNLEPVYAITMATLFLSEQRELKPTFYFGVVIVLAVVFAYPLFSRARAA
jgi:drug/metabolite transporter (DMT)-like permease